MVASIVTGAIFYNPYYQYDTLDAAAYSVLHRTVWSIGKFPSLIFLLYIYSIFDLIAFQGVLECCTSQAMASLSGFTPSWLGDRGYH